MVCTFGFKRLTHRGSSGFRARTVQLTPFWSLDDQHVGFFVSPAFGGGGRIKRVNLATDAVETISDLPGVTGNIDIPSGAWNSSGDLIVTLQGIFHRPVSGGSLEPLVIPDLARGEAFLSFPQFLPDGQHYLFTAFGRDGDDKEAYVGTLGSKTRKSILRAQSAAWYVAPGYLLFARAGTLFAQRFDASRFTLSGRAVRVAGGLLVNSITGPRIRVSQAGTLFLMTGEPGRAQFTWFDRTGRETGRVGDPIDAFAFDVAMDGAVAVTSVGLPGTLWRIDARRGTVNRLTDGLDDADLRLSADGKSGPVCGNIRRPPGARSCQSARRGANTALRIHDTRLDTPFSYAPPSARLVAGWAVRPLRRDWQPQGDCGRHACQWSAASGNPNERFCRSGEILS